MGLKLGKFLKSIFTIRGKSTPRSGGPFTTAEQAALDAAVGALLSYGPVGYSDEVRLLLARDKVRAADDLWSQHNMAGAYVPGEDLILIDRRTLQVMPPRCVGIVLMDEVHHRRSPGHTTIKDHLESQQMQAQYVTRWKQLHRRAWNSVGPGEEQWAEYIGGLAP